MKKISMLQIQCLKIVTLISLMAPAFASAAPVRLNGGASLAGDGQFLGEFKVSSLYSSDGKGVMSTDDDCLDSSKTYRCGDLVWAYQKDNEVILISKPTTFDKKNDSNVSPYDIDCKHFYKPLSEAKKNGIFHIGECTAKIDSEGLSNSDADQSDASGVVLGSLSSVFVAGANQIKLDSPNIIIHQTMVAASIFFIPLGRVHADHDLILTPITSP